MIEDEIEDHDFTVEISQKILLSKLFMIYVCTIQRLAIHMTLN